MVTQKLQKARKTAESASKTDVESQAVSEPKLGVAGQIEAEFKTCYYAHSRSWYIVNDDNDYNVLSR
jgi:hypothetical protein